MITCCQGGLDDRDRQAPASRLRQPRPCGLLTCRPTRPRRRDTGHEGRRRTVEAVMAGLHRPTADHAPGHSGPLNRSSSVPLYYQLQELLKEKIESEVWRPGDLL